MINLKTFSLTWIWCPKDKKPNCRGCRKEWQKECLEKGNLYPASSVRPTNFWLEDERYGKLIGENSQILC